MKKKLLFVYIKKFEQFLNIHLAIELMRQIGKLSYYNNNNRCDTHNFHIFRCN